MDKDVIHDYDSDVLSALTTADLAEQVGIRSLPVPITWTALHKYAQAVARHAQMEQVRLSRDELVRELCEALELSAYCLRWHHERTGRDSKADQNALDASDVALKKARGEQ